MARVSFCDDVDLHALRLARRRRRPARGSAGPAGSAASSRRAARPESVGTSPERPTVRLPRGVGAAHEVLHVVERDRLDAGHRAQHRDARRACPRRAWPAAAPCPAPPRCSSAGPGERVELRVLQAPEVLLAEAGVEQLRQRDVGEGGPVVAVDGRGERRHLLVDLGVEAARHRVEGLLDLVDALRSREPASAIIAAASAASPSLPGGIVRGAGAEQQLHASCGSADRHQDDLQRRPAAAAGAREAGQRRARCRSRPAAASLRQRRDHQPRRR